MVTSGGQFALSDLNQLIEKRGVSGYLFTLLAEGQRWDFIGLECSFLHYVNVYCF